jgi:hypothetical protein
LAIIIGIFDDPIAESRTVFSGASPIGFSIGRCPRPVPWIIQAEYPAFSAASIMSAWRWGPAINWAILILGSNFVGEATGRDDEFVNEV